MMSEVLDRVTLADMIAMGVSIVVETISPNQKHYCSPPKGYGRDRRRLTVGPGLQGR